MEEMKVNEKLLKCNDWDCIYNNDGICSNLDALTKCQDDLLVLIRKGKVDSSWKYRKEEE